MIQSQRFVSELTIEEFTLLIKRTVRAVLEEERTHPVTPAQMGLLDIPPVSIGGLKDDAKFISREEYYDDER
jgi:hypothetical protein